MTFEQPSPDLRAISKQLCSISALEEGDPPSVAIAKANGTKGYYDACDVEVLDDGPDGHHWRCHTCGTQGYYDAGVDTGAHE